MISVLELREEWISSFFWILAVGSKVQNGGCLGETSQGLVLGDLEGQLLQNFTQGMS